MHLGVGIHARSSVRLNSTDVQAEKECGERVQRANAFDLKDTRAGVLNVDVWHNDKTKIGGETIGALKRIAKPIDRVVNSWLQAWLGDGFSARLLAQMDMPKPPTALLLDFSSIVGPLFFVWLVQLPLPWAVVQLVYEKEKRLRTMMRIHGLENGAPRQPKPVTYSAPLQLVQPCRVARQSMENWWRRLVALCSRRECQCAGVYMAVMYGYFIVQYILYIVIMLIAGNAADLQCAPPPAPVSARACPCTCDSALVLPPLDCTPVCPCAYPGKPPSVLRRLRDVA